MASYFARSMHYLKKGFVQTSVDLPIFSIFSKVSDAFHPSALCQGLLYPYFF